MGKVAIVIKSLIFITYITKVGIISIILKSLTKRKPNTSSLEWLGLTLIDKSSFNIPMFLSLSRSCEQLALLQSEVPTKK